MFLLVCANALRSPRTTCRRVASSQIVACASQPRRAVVLITDVDAPEPAALDMVTTLRSQGWAVRLASSSAGASAALAEDPQAVFELQRSASSFALQEECEARQACLYAWQAASATFKRQGQGGSQGMPSHISPAPSFEAEAERRGWGFLDLSGLHEDEIDPTAEPEPSSTQPTARSAEAPPTIPITPAAAEPLLCVVCLDEERACVMVPCGHRVLCTSCAAERWDECPVCRAKCDSVMRVYDS